MHIQRALNFKVGSSEEIGKETTKKKYDEKNMNEIKAVGESFFPVMFLLPYLNHRACKHYL